MLGANARRPLALCQAAPDAASCFLPARGEPREASAAPLCARRGGGGGAARGQRAPEFPAGTWEGWGARWEREVNAPVRRQTTPGVPAAFRPRGDPAGARAMRLLGARALPDPAPACGTHAQSQAQACAYLYLKSAVFPARAQGQGGGHIGRSLATSVTKLKFDCWVSLDYFKVILRYL